MSFKKNNNNKNQTVKLCSPSQVYRDSDIDLFTFGTPINTVSLFTILLHLSIEIKAWVSPELMDICYNGHVILKDSHNSSICWSCLTHVPS